MKVNLPYSIKSIASELKSLSNIDSNIISEIVSAVNITENELSQYYSFDHPDSESYGRNLILDSGKFKIEIALLTISDVCC